MEPEPDIQQNQCQDKFPSNESVKAVRAWNPKGYSGETDNAERADNENDQFDHAVTSGKRPSLPSQV
jgi:hypothetical protein